MLSRALIVCLLALFCLQITLANRLEARIASPFVSKQGQFPYIVSLQYVSAGITYQSTGIIYSTTAIITTANVFNNYPPTGAQITIGAGAYDLTQATQVITFPGNVIGKYALVANGTTAPAPPANTNILVPTTFTPGSSNDDIAVIIIPAGATGGPLTFGPEIQIANFPTSSLIPSETIFAVAYGNQGAGSPVFPQLKYAPMKLMQSNRCKAKSNATGVSKTVNTAQQFCVSSQLPADTNNTFNGVCASDIGGAIVRDGDITNVTNYYEVIGLISYAGDNTTCNPNAPSPVFVTYLSVYYSSFISPLAGTLAAAGNKQNAALNPNSGKGNFICGNGIVEGPYEKCEGATNACCNPWTCAFRPGGFFCGPRPKNGTAINKCLTRPHCNGNPINGQCVQTPKKGKKKPCAGKGTRCLNGVCNKCAEGTCTPV
jgi:hypothetical protein